MLSVERAPGKIAEWMQRCTCPLLLSRKIIRNAKNGKPPTGPQPNHTLALLQATNGHCRQAPKRVTRRRGLPKRGASAPPSCAGTSAAQLPGRMAERWERRWRHCIAGCWQLRPRSTLPRVAHPGLRHWAGRAHATAQHWSPFITLFSAGSLRDEERRGAVLLHR